MAPFERAESVLAGFKDKVDAVAVHGDKLYLGTSTGNLHVYTFKDGSGSAEEIVVKKGLSRRSIEQLGYVKDINSLVVLSEKQVTLYALPDISPPTVLSKAKAAFSFVVQTFVQHLLPDGQPVQTSSVGFDKSTAVPTLVTYLLVGCQRKLVIYSWKDGEAQDVKEATLPHSPRTMAFLNNDVVCLAYQPDFVLFSLRTHSITEVTTPIPSSLSVPGIGKGTLSGLGGYMTLGLGTKAKPCAVNVGDSEVLIAKDNFGVFVGTDGKQSRPNQIEWPATPEDLAFVKPHIFALLPAGTVPTSSLTNAPSNSNTKSDTVTSSPVLQIRSSISLIPSQTLSFPFDQSSTSSTASESTTSTTATHTLRLLTPSPNAKSPLFVISTPVDRATAANEGSTLWRFKMKSWGEQVDELVEEGSYGDAIKLLDTLDEAVLPDKDRRKSLCRALDAVSQFTSGRYDEALDTFIALNINPAKVVALYPASVSGRLAVPQNEWIPLFGGPKPPEPSSDDAGAQAKKSASIAEEGSEEGESVSASEGGPSRGRSPPPGGSIGPGKSRWRPALDVFKPSGGKDPDTASISSQKQRRPNDAFTRSVESLLRYLPDRRIKLATSLETFHITSQQAHEHKTLLSSTPLPELFSIPSYTPLSNLTPQQLVQCAQVVDTALFKAYLVIRPGLIGSLCRQPNWCEVEEVEEILMAKEKYAELIVLYNGKKIHHKALDLLHTLSEKETDMRDKLEPSIMYLQRLGPEHLDQIFKSSRWLFDQDADMAFEIFTSEEVELPRDPVVAYLEGINPRLGARYLEYLMQERKEETVHNGDRLAELYLKMTKDAMRKKDEETRAKIYDKFLDFIDSSQHYQVDRLFGHLPSEGFFEAKAILLGRLDRHDSALEIYVYRLHDYPKAEEYCKRVYNPSSATSSIFLTLLRIYLRPSPSYQTSKDDNNTLLRPALDLISRHSRRIDAEEALQLLPPLVSAQDLRAFLLEALREPVFDTMVVRDISKARSEQVARRLMWLQSNRVKVTDSRICPQCHKRIGHSSIAVHTPGGEVTHYHCREAFSHKLKEMRHT